MLKTRLLNCVGGEEKLYSSDVFSTHLYTGNGATQTINNGIDLAGEGGMVWVKSRNGTTSHKIFDTTRDSVISSDSVNDAGGGIIPTYFDFTGSGFNLGNLTVINEAVTNYASWTFRKSPRFFDVVTYTGNGVAGRQIAHNLNCEPGMIVTKSTSTAGDWNTYHRSATGDLKLNTTNAKTASRTIITAADTGTFTVSGVANTNGVVYVSYLFAHDDSAD